MYRSAVVIGSDEKEEDLSEDRAFCRVILPIFVELPHITFVVSEKRTA
jgi:hypothetical protein